jgi:hypothetical protein
MSAFSFIASPKLSRNGGGLIRILSLSQKLHALQRALISLEHHSKPLMDERADCLCAPFDHRS